MTASGSAPDILTPEVQLAFQTLAQALDDAAKAHGVALVSLALTWAAEWQGHGVFNCMFDANMTPEMAEAMAGVLIMDAEECDFQTHLPPVIRQ